MGGERILIVEDERLIRSSLMERLTRERYDVTEAEDGKTGLRLLGDEEFDLLLLDFRLPDTDGLKTTVNVPATLDEHASVSSQTNAQ